MKMNEKSFLRKQLNLLHERKEVRSFGHLPVVPLAIHRKYRCSEPMGLSDCQIPVSPFGFAVPTLWLVPRPRRLVHRRVADASGVECERWLAACRPVFFHCQFAQFQPSRGRWEQLASPAIGWQSAEWMPAVAFPSSLIRGNWFPRMIELELGSRCQTRLFAVCPGTCRHLPVSASHCSHVPHRNSSRTVRVCPRRECPRPCRDFSPSHFAIGRVPLSSDWPAKRIVNNWLGLCLMARVNLHLPFHISMSSCCSAERSAHCFRGMI